MIFIKRLLYATYLTLWSLFKGAFYLAAIIGSIGTVVYLFSWACRGIEADVIAGFLWAAFIGCGLLISVAGLWWTNWKATENNIK